MIIRTILTGFLRSHTVFRLLLFVIFLTIAFGIIIHYIEPDSFPTIFDGIWWVIVTCSTIGYGDYVPASVLGRIIAILLIMLGAGFFTFYMVTLSSTTIDIINGFNEGSATYKGDSHIIIIGWNERSKETIDQLLSLEKKYQIVLVDHTLDKNPLNINNVHFIKGESTNDNTLKKANIEKAEFVLITADQHKAEHDADMGSILSLLAIKGLNPSVYCIVEILTDEQVNNALRAGANELLETNKLSSFVMIDSILSPGISSVLLLILNQLKGSRITFISVPPALFGFTFKECLEYYLKDEILLIGVKKGDESFVNPPLSSHVHESDQLLIIQR